MYWSPVSRIYNLTRLSSAGELRDLERGQPRGTSSSCRTRSARRTAISSRAPTPNYVRDFGDRREDRRDVEPQRSISPTTPTSRRSKWTSSRSTSRGSTCCFPEKRPFFLENRGLFAVGKTGEVDLFFSRRIGIDRDGNLVPIRRWRPAHGQGQRHQHRPAQHADRRDAADRVEQFLGRAGQQGPARTARAFGGIFVNRAGMGDLATDHDWNRTWGVDGRLGIGEAMTFQGFVARTETPGAVESEHAFSGSGRIPQPAVPRPTSATRRSAKTSTPRWDSSSARRPTGSSRRGTTTTCGPRRLTNGASASCGRTRRTRASGISTASRKRRPCTSTCTWTWRTATSSAPPSTGSTKACVEPFEVYPGVIVPPGQYAGFHTAFAGNTDRRKTLSFSGELELRRVPVGEPERHRAVGHVPARWHLQRHRALAAQRHRSAAGRVCHQSRDRCARPTTSTRS